MSNVGIALSHTKFQWLFISMQMIDRLCHTYFYEAGITEYERLPDILPYYNSVLNHYWKATETLLVHNVGESRKQRQRNNGENKSHSSKIFCKHNWENNWEEKKN